MKRDIWPKIRGDKGMIKVRDKSRETFGKDLVAYERIVVDVSEMEKTVSDLLKTESVAFTREAELKVNRLKLTPKNDKPYTITIETVSFADNSMYTVCAIKTQCSIDYMNKVIQQHVDPVKVKYDFILPILSKAGLMLSENKGMFPDSLFSDLVKKHIFLTSYKECEFPSEMALELGQIMVGQYEKWDIDGMVKMHDEIQLNALSNGEDIISDEENVLMNLGEVICTNE
jgi:hypothetical protein